MSEQDVSERIKILFAEFGNGNLSAFSRSISVNHQTVRDLMRGDKGGPSWPVLQNILQAFPSVRLEWLLLGEGEMLKSAPKPDTPQENLSYTAARAAGEVGVDGGLLIERGKAGVPNMAITPKSRPLGLDLVEAVTRHDAELAEIREVLAKLRAKVAK